MIVNNIITIDDRFFRLDEILYFELKEKVIIAHRKSGMPASHLRFLRESDAELAFSSIPEEYRNNHS